MLTSKEKSLIQESLTTLYLRLNGYLTTGFIFQSSPAVSGEVDIVGIRFPFHSQDETEHNSSPMLEIGDHIDVVIGEVKSKGKQLQFNESLRNKANIAKLLRWCGLFQHDLITGLVSELHSLLEPIENSQRKYLLSTKFITTKFGLVKIRPLIFSLERIHPHNADKFIGWNEINDFIWQCLCPANERADCGTRYDFNIWGQGLSDVVKVYKARQKAQAKPESIEDLYLAMSHKQ